MSFGISRHHLQALAAAMDFLGAFLEQHCWTGIFFRTRSSSV